MVLSSGKTKNRQKEINIKITRSFIKIINLNTYKVEVSGTMNNGRYEFRLIVTPMFGKPQEFHGQLSEKFVEEEIDKNKDVNYLDILSVNVAETYLKDILRFNGHGIIGNTNSWFIEAKRALAQERLKKRKNIIRKYTQKFNTNN